MKSDQHKESTTLQNLQGQNLPTGLRACRWTLILSAGLTILNLGLFDFAPSIFTSLIDTLQYDRAAVGQGEVWRLMTGNFMHWSAAHFLLDIGAFLVLGVIYERYFGRAYLPILTATTATVGVCVHLFSPEMTTYRGLSGVDSGLFAAILCVEAILACRDRIRWIWAAPAIIVFTVKIAYESITGQLFFETQSLGDLGIPTAMAHLSGAIAGVTAIVLILVQANRKPTADRRRTLMQSVASDRG